MNILNLVSKIVSLITKLVLKEKTITQEVKKLSIDEKITKQLKTNWDKYESGSITRDEYNRRNQIAVNYRLKDRLQGLVY